MPAETAFKPEFAKQARQMAECGATDREIAEEFGVSVRTLHRWKHTHEGFAEQLKLGKELPDDRVEQSLYRRATGYTFEAQKVLQYKGEPVVVDYLEHVPPDTTAAIFWLKNRRKEDWRDKAVIEHENVDDLADALMRARQRAIEAQSGTPNVTDALNAGRELRRKLEGATIAPEAKEN